MNSVIIDRAIITRTLLSWRQKAVANKKKRAKKILEIIKPVLIDGAKFIINTDPRGWTYKIEVPNHETIHPALRHLNTDMGGDYYIA